MILRHSGFHVMPDASHLPGSGREEEHVMPDASHLTNTPASWIGCHAGPLTSAGFRKSFPLNNVAVLHNVPFYTTCRSTQRAVLHNVPFYTTCRSTQRAVFMKRRTRLIALTFIDGN